MTKKVTAVCLKTKKTKCLDQSLLTAKEKFKNYCFQVILWRGVSYAPKMGPILEISSAHQLLHSKNLTLGFSLNFAGTALGPQRPYPGK